MLARHYELLHFVFVATCFLAQIGCLKRNRLHCAVMCHPAAFMAESHESECVYDRRPQRAQLNNCINLFDKKSRVSVCAYVLQHKHIKCTRTRRAEIEKEATRTRLGAGRVLRNCYDSLHVYRMMHLKARIAPKIAHTLFRA